jgi:hypothetical protein
MHTRNLSQKPGHRIVMCADKRSEVDWAGGNVGWKIGFASNNWPVLIAGDESKAVDLINTCRETFKDKDSNYRVGPQSATEYYGPLLIDT